MPLKGYAWGRDYQPQPVVREAPKESEDWIAEHLRWLAWWHGEEKQRRAKFAETCPLALWFKEYEAQRLASEWSDRNPTRARTSERKRRASSENAKRTQAVRLRNRKRNGR